MKRILTIFVLALGLMGTTGLALADQFDGRRAAQHDRIRDGWRDGDLTRREAWHLRQGQRRIHRFHRRAAFDGRLTARERFRVHRAYNHQSRLIYRLRHNARCR